MIKIKNYFSLLGFESGDSKVENMFKELNVKRRPQLTTPPRSPYEAVLQIKSLGILLAFTDKYYQENSARHLHGKSGVLIFDNIAITSGIPDVMRCYEGEMPFGLEWTDTRETVRAKMTALGHAEKLHAYTRDAWWLDEYNVRITYSPETKKDNINNSTIHEISIGLRRPATITTRPASDYPSINQLRNLFGKSAGSIEFREAFHHFDPDKLMADISLEAINRKREYGFEIYFDPKRPAADGSPSFVGIDMVRDRLGDSHPWLGELPYSLDFDDSPALLEGKVGLKANQWEEMNVWGIARWFLKNELVWVQFDNLNNRIESVSILASGYRDDLLH